MAAKLGFRQATLSQWESEKAEPDVTSLETIASFFGYTMESFWAYLNGKNELKIVKESDITNILKALDTMPPNELALIGSTVMQKLAQVS